MKIEKLIIHNIASLTDAEIDFTKNPLRDASLFLIDGMTGSGKSTILDAICLALYGITPRMDEAAKEEVHVNYFKNGDNTDNAIDILRTNDTKQLLRRGAIDGFVELYFIGNDNGHYLTKWEIKHSYNRLDGKLQAPKQSLQNLDNMNVYAKSELRSQIEKVVGLRFDQFCRTTLLAQGDFTKFLYSKEDEKADILEKLTGTGQYARIGRMVYVMFDEEKEKYNNQMTRINMMVCLSDEDVASLNNTLTEQKALQDKLKKETEALNGQLTWIREYDKKVKELDARQKEMNSKTAETEKGSYKKETQIIEDYNISESARNDSKDLDRAKKNLQAEKEKSAGYKTRYISLLAANENLHQDIKRHEENKSKLAEAVEIATKNAAEIQKEIEDKTEKIKNFRLKLDLMNESGLKADNKNLADKIDTCNKAGYSHRYLMTAKKIETDAETDLKLQEHSLADKQKQFEVWKERYSNCDKDFEIKDEVYRKISQSVQDWAKEARKKLKIGDRCPVCGQEVRSLLHDDDFKSLLTKPEKERNEARKALDNAAANVKALQANIRDIERMMPQYRKKVKDAIEGRTKRENELIAICKSIDGFEYSAENDAEFTDGLAKALDMLTNKKKELDNKLAEIDRQNKRIDKEKDKLVKLQKRLNKAESDKSKKEREQSDNIKEIESLSRSLKACDHMKASMSDVLVKWNSARGASVQSIPVTELQTAWTTFSTDIAGWRKALNLYKTTIEEKQKNINDFLNNHPTISKEYLVMLSQYTIAQINELKFSHKKTEDEITTAKGAISTLEGQIDKAKKEKPQMDEDVTVEMLEKSIEEKNTQKDNTGKTVAEISVRLQKNKEAREEKAKAEKTLEALKQKYNKWKVFNELFGSKDGKKFKMIAESFILSHLLRLANKYLEQFTDRFSLGCAPGSLVILIRDRYQGNRAFGSNTLSGGESFLVSLSLALGLSQLNTSRNAVDTLFIDEGFGTLDGDYLNAVMDALGKLHQIAGRRVGIISHVDILSSLIPVQIQVRKVNPTQSKVSITEQTE